MPSTDGLINAPTTTNTIISGRRRSVAASCESRPAPSMSPKSRRMCSTSAVPSLSGAGRNGDARGYGSLAERGASIILAEGYWLGDEYIPEMVDDPWAKLERVAQVLGRKTDLHAYADPRRVAQELAEDVSRAYEQGDLSGTLVGRPHDLIDSTY
jgi:hypothetical protein